MTKRNKHSPDFKANVALEAIREEMTMAELNCQVREVVAEIRTS